MKRFPFLFMLMMSPAFGAGSLSCDLVPVNPDLTDLLKVVEPNPLSQRKTKCIEDAMPSKKSPGYADRVEALKNTTDIRGDDYMYPWLFVKAAETADEKVKRLYEASAKYNIPPAVLFGALGQESSWMEMGIAEDYGNWACGVAQLNVNDWCGWASSADTATQRLVNWPVEDIKSFKKNHPDVNVCDTDFIVPEHAKPFYEVALQRLKAEKPDAPEYMLEGRHARLPGVAAYGVAHSGLDKVSKSSLENKTLLKNPNAQLLRYKMAASFAGSCSDSKFGIPAAAHTFKMVFDTLPKELQNAQRYQAGEARPVQCQQTTSDYYPLHVGWLLANAIYNAGPEILPGVLAWQKNSGIPWEKFSPENLVDAIKYSLSLKNTGISAIGAQEAQNHVPGVLNGTRIDSED